MYKYIIGESCFEDYHEIELLHEKQYTKEEFFGICKKAFNEITLKEKEDIINCRGDKGIYEIKEILFNKYGFIKPKEITNYIHINDLIKGYTICCDCPKFYYLNNKPQCDNLNNCEFSYYFIDKYK